MQAYKKRNLKLTRSFLGTALLRVTVRQSNSNKGI